MRGALVDPGVPGARRGIIPAYAGSTSGRCRDRAAWRDHPRICGEHYYDMSEDEAREGSSPHMRGAPKEVDTHGSRRGIIPAYAGSTCPRSWRRWWRGDHPRICGEHGQRVDDREVFAGSSPHMRGAHSHVGSFLGLAGIIPAYAGSTGPAASVRSCARDHPRICGEHLEHRSSDVRAPGSSPHMRGALHEALRDVGLDGIIPAYAGSTTSSTSDSAPCWDHPRICGEHSKPLFLLQN